MPAEGNPKQLLVGFVDHGRFGHLDIETAFFDGREQMIGRLREMLSGAHRIAMEYSPLGDLPRVSKVDAGTVEMVRSLGVDIVSSGDTVHYAAQRWDRQQLQSHRDVADTLGAIVGEAFAYIGGNISSGISEMDVARFIRRRFGEECLDTPDGPIMAVNEHSSDPHFDPTQEASVAVQSGDWVLIVLWARLKGDETMYADITWTAYVGERIPDRHQEVFAVVAGARDAALAEIGQAFESGRPVQGREVDRVARDHVERAGYGAYFGHRLGHSPGTEVHGNAVNLDGRETNDTRQLIPGVCVTIEPGIYLADFGVRSEIDVYISESGPAVTTELQRSPVLIRSR